MRGWEWRGAACLGLQVTHWSREHGSCPLFDIQETKQKYKLKNPTRHPKAPALQEQCWVPEDRGPRPKALHFPRWEPLVGQFLPCRKPCCPFASVLSATVSLLSSG